MTDNLAAYIPILSNSHYFIEQLYFFLTEHQKFNFLLIFLFLIEVVLMF